MITVTIPTVVTTPHDNFISDVPTMVRSHAPHIRRYLGKWREDIEADDFLRGDVIKGNREYMAFQCVKFPKSEAMIPSIEFTTIEFDHADSRVDVFSLMHDMLLWRGWSDLFTNIHADCVRTEVQSEIKLRAREVWKQLFPNSRPMAAARPPADRMPRGLGFQFRDDWCHHCEAATVHSNSEHDPWTFHCTQSLQHSARPRFEN